MELILISNTKLKIMLNESDMLKYNIGRESDCARSSTRRAIRSLLERAKDQIGFNTEGEEIFVQLYTSKSGGCELFVTKCEADQGIENLPEMINCPVAEAETIGKRKTKSQAALPVSLPPSDTSKFTAKLSEAIRMPPSADERKTRMAFSFPSLNELITVCRLLADTNLSIESKAFADDRGGYYLLLESPSLSAFSRLDRLTFIIEYGRRENPDCLVSYISEHGKVICREGAIETLCRF